MCCVFFSSSQPCWACQLTWGTWGLDGWFYGGGGSSCHLRCPWTSRPGGRGWFYGPPSAPHTVGLEHSIPSRYSSKEPECTRPWKEAQQSYSSTGGKERYQSVIYAKKWYVTLLDIMSSLTWKWWCWGAWVCEGVWSLSLWCHALSLQPRPLRGTCRGRRPPAPRCPPTAGPRSPQKEPPRTLNADQQVKKTNTMSKPKIIMHYKE